MFEAVLNKIDYWNAYETFKNQGVKYEGVMSKCPFDLAFFAIMVKNLSWY